MNRPFTVKISDAEAEDLRARIVATRLPEKEPVEDASQGVQLVTMQALVRYRGTEYDLQRVERRLNALPQFLAEIDGLDIHFIHVKSRHENALPVIMIHGWPGLGGRAAEGRRPPRRLPKHTTAAPRTRTTR